MTCNDKGRSRRSMPEKIFNSRIADIAINSNIGKELGKGSSHSKRVLPSIPFASADWMLLV